MLNKFEQIASNRVKDLPWINFRGNDYQIGRWTYGISCWYRETYGDTVQGTPAVTAHVISKLIPELFEEYGGDLGKLESAIYDLEPADIQVIDEQIAYSISLSTDPNATQVAKKKQVNRITAIKAWTLLTVWSLTLLLAGMAIAYLVFLN